MEYFFNIHIKTLTEMEILVEVADDYTIAQVKQSIFAITGLNCNNQTLLFKGEELLDELFVNQYNIQDESTLNLVIKIQSGPLNYVSVPGTSSCANNNNLFEEDVEETERAKNKDTQSQDRELYAISPLGKCTLSSPLALIPTLKLFLSSLSSTELEQLWKDEKSIILTTLLKDHWCDFTLRRQSSLPKNLSSPDMQKPLHNKCSTTTKPTKHKLTQKEKKSPYSVPSPSNKITAKPPALQQTQQTLEQTTENENSFEFSSKNKANASSSDLPRFIVNVERKQVYNVTKKKHTQYKSLSHDQRRRTSTRGIEKALLTHHQVSHHQVTKSKMENILDTIRERKARLSQKKVANTAV
eukprot:Awhi_evm1s5627